MTETEIPSKSEDIVFHKHPENKRFIDLTGRSFNFLTVIGYAGSKLRLNGGKNHYWWCQCVCGTKKIVQCASIKYGGTKSCGCKKSGLTIEHRKTHGMCYSAEYGIWCGMIKRCYSQNHKHFSRYGGRGIKVFPDWIRSFSSFYECLGNRPSKLHTLDRINNDGDYEPGNVRWATGTEQSRNRSSNKLFTYNGETKCLTEWAELFGIRRSCAFSRLNAGWSFEEAMTLGIRKSVNGKYCEL